MGHRETTEIYVDGEIDHVEVEMDSVKVVLTAETPLEEVYDELNEAVDRAVSAMERHE